VNPANRECGIKSSLVGARSISHDVLQPYSNAVAEAAGLRRSADLAREVEHVQDYRMAVQQAVLEMRELRRLKHEMATRGSEARRRQLATHGAAAAQSSSHPSVVEREIGAVDQFDVRVGQRGKHDVAVEPGHRVAADQ
jgi:hypothetical protein